MWRGRTPAAKQITKQMIASISAVPRSGSFTTRPAKIARAVIHGRKVFQNDPSSPARRSRKRARNKVRDSLAISDGWAEKPANLIQRRAPLMGGKAKTATSKTTAMIPVRFTFILLMETPVANTY